MKAYYKRKNHIKIPVAIVGARRVKVGFISSKASEENILKALWNNYGTASIPPRPFFDNAMKDNKKKYIQALKSSSSKIIRKETNLNTVMGKLGELAKGDIQREITSLRTPPNARKTIVEKGSSNPLIDTGDMRKSVSWKLDV